MPSKPLCPCNKIGCMELIKDRYCQQHQATKVKRLKQQRKTATQRGYNNRWRKERTTYLRHHPLCVDCERNGRAVLATVVDHIIPHKGDRESFGTKAIGNRCVLLA